MTKQPRTEREVRRAVKAWRAHAWVIEINGMPLMRTLDFDERRVSQIAHDYRLGSQSVEIVPVEIRPIRKAKKP